jgi:hypothetical protein
LPWPFEFVIQSLCHLQQPSAFGSHLRQDPLEAGRLLQQSFQLSQDLAAFFAVAHRSTRYTLLPNRIVPWIFSANRKRRIDGYPDDRGVVVYDSIDGTDQIT